MSCICKRSLRCISFLFWLDFKIPCRILYKLSCINKFKLLNIHNENLQEFSIFIKRNPYVSIDSCII